MKISGYRCKFCKSADLVMMETEYFTDNPETERYYYIYHYSLNYDLGCRERIGLLDIHKNLERKNDKN